MEEEPEDEDSGEDDDMLLSVSDNGALAVAPTRGSVASGTDIELGSNGGEGCVRTPTPVVATCWSSVRVLGLGSVTCATVSCTSPLAAAMADFSLALSSNSRIRSSSC